MVIYRALKEAFDKQSHTNIQPFVEIHVYTLLFQTISFSTALRFILYVHTVYTTTTLNSKHLTSTSLSLPSLFQSFSSFSQLTQAAQVACLLLRYNHTMCLCTYVSTCVFVSLPSIESAFSNKLSLLLLSLSLFTSKDECK